MEKPDVKSSFLSFIIIEGDKKEDDFIKNALKNLTAILIVLCMVLSLTISVAATSIVQPCYIGNNKVILNLTFSSSGADCYGKITGDTGTTKIDNCTFTLTDSKGVEVKSWSNLSSTGATLIFSKTASSVTKGETYTLSVSATVHRNGNSEKISDSITVKYN